MQNSVNTLPTRVCTQYGLVPILARVADTLSLMLPSTVLNSVVACMRPDIVKLLEKSERL